MTVFKNMDKSKKIVLICAAAFVILSFVACVVFVNDSGSKQIGADQNTKQSETQEKVTQDAAAKGEGSGEQDQSKEAASTEEKMPLHVIEPGSTQVTGGASSPSESPEMPAQQQSQSDSESPSDPNGVETPLDVL